MDGKTLARLAAVVVIAVAVTAAAIHLARDDPPAGSNSSPSAITDGPRADHLRAALQRCRELGEAGTRDEECLAAWDENRRRFLNATEGH